MANKCGQYWNGTTWSQLPTGGLTTADITLQGGGVADVFYTMKDTNDNLFILCYHTTTPNSLAKIIRITKDGVKTTANWGNAASRVPPTSKTPLLLTRDDSTIFAVDGNNGLIWALPTNFTEGATLTAQTNSVMGWYIANASAAIYKNLYIWVASGTTVKIYDYTTKAELASVIPQGLQIGNIALATNNEAYLVMRTSSDPAFTSAGVTKCVFNGTNIITSSVLPVQNAFKYPKQLLIDRFGDLIILTNSGTASTLLKYTTAGTLIDTKVLSGPMYNLAIDVDGNYFYYTALKEFQIDKNTAQGQAFTSVGYETRGTGNTGFGSNSTGYQPSVYA